MLLATAIAQYIPVDTARINKAYNILTKGNRTSETEMEFLEAYPTTWFEFYMTYSYLYDDTNQNIMCDMCAHEFSADDTAEEVADVARDSNAAELFDGDAVTVIKDLKVKGSSMVIKRGTKVKSIRLTENPEEVDCKIDGSSIVLKTCFLKK